MYIYVCIYANTTTCIFLGLFIYFLHIRSYLIFILSVAVLNVCDVNIKPILNLSANTITLSFFFYIKFLKKCCSLSIIYKVFGMKHFNIISCSFVRQNTAYLFILQIFMHRISNHKLIVLNLFC